MDHLANRIRYQVVYANYDVSTTRVECDIFYRHSSTTREPLCMYAYDCVCVCVCVSHQLLAYLSFSESSVNVWNLMEQWW